MSTSPCTYCQGRGTRLLAVIPKMAHCRLSDVIVPVPEPTVRIVDCWVCAGSGKRSKYPPPKGLGVND